CEACGYVRHFSVSSTEDCEQIFNEFQCPNNCGRNLYSYITVGTFRRQTVAASKEPVGAYTVREL
ncbi:MAG: hypothetical protein ONB15_10960, partial [candidate division KSB1 bacterium]|nr:hypothetical protein [candidate division KSB1 bacterium]